MLGNPPKPLAFRLKRPSGRSRKSATFSSKTVDIADATTLGALAQQRATSLCHLLNVDSGIVLDTLHTLARGWATRCVSTAAVRSDITDDHSPFEFSLAFDDGPPQLRLLAEAQGAEPSLASNWDAAWAVNEELERRFGASLTRAREIADLFAPDDPAALFALWHAVGFGAQGRPAFKLYFNPRAHGSAEAGARTREALERLGLDAAARWLESHALARGETDELIYFSLDLSASEQARTKIYVAHRGATVGDLEAVLAAGHGHAPGDALRFCRAMTGQREAFERRPLLTCAAFVGPEPRPSTVTLHLPIRAYVSDDQAALERIQAFLSPADAAIYEAALRRLATRSLSAGTGVQTYTSFRRQAGRERLTVYLSPEVYRSQPERGSDKACA